MFIKTEGNRWINTNLVTELWYHEDLRDNAKHPYELVFRNSAGINYSIKYFKTKKEMMKIINKIEKDA